LACCVFTRAAVGVLPLTTDDQSWHEEHSGSASLTNAEQHSLPGNKIDCHTMEERLHRVRRQLPASTQSANVQIIYVTLGKHRRKESVKEPNWGYALSVNSKNGTNPYN